MTGQQLKRVRKQKRWTQKQAAKNLRLTQGYLSLLEKGKRPLTEILTKKVIHVFGLSPAALPVKKDLTRLSFGKDKGLTRDLAAVGYPGFSHVKSSRVKNPAEVLISALGADKLDARVTEALPWLVSEVSEADWSKVVAAAKVRDLQNRLGFVTSLARKVAEKKGEKEKVAALKRREVALADSRLFKEDTLCADSLTEAEKRWISENRTAEAEFWRVLSDLKAEHLSYAD